MQTSPEATYNTLRRKTTTVRKRTLSGIDCANLKYKTANPNNSIKSAISLASTEFSDLANEFKDELKKRVSAVKLASKKIAEKCIEKGIILYFLYKKLNQKYFYILIFYNKITS